MPAALPIPLRERIVDAYNEKGGYHRIAQQFSVGVSSVQRYVEQAKNQNSLEPKPHNGGPPPKILPEQHDELEKFVMQRADWSIPELTEAWASEKKIKIATSSFSRALSRANLTYKKKLGVPLSVIERISLRKKQLT